MSDQAAPLVVTLTAEHGQKWDAEKKRGAIGTYRPAGSGRRSPFHLVFMPDGVEPGQQVRLTLREIKPDSAGHMMYRGSPAPVAYAEKWRDNGDGTASRVTISTNWLLQESEEGVLETRPLATREWDPPSVRHDLKVVWGVDQVSSFVERVATKIYTQQAEKVTAGQMVWVNTGTREEQGAPEQLPVLQVKVGYGDFGGHKLELVWSDAWTLTADCYFAVNTEYTRENTSYGKLPKWVQAQLLNQYPTCGSCGTVRYNKEETSWCATCRPYRETEQWIVASLTPKRKLELSVEAAKLLGAGSALEGELGVAILKATLDHIGDSWRRDDFVQRWTGYGWYYFCDDAVYGSKLSPAALQILQFLPHASGDRMVEMVAWLSGGHKQNFSDYYAAAQVRGERVQLPVGLQNVVENLAAGRTGLAERLRGGEPDRLLALQEYRGLGDNIDRDSREFREVGNLLVDGDQDYAKALRRIRGLPSRRPAVIAAPAPQQGRAAAWEEPDVPRHQEMPAALDPWQQQLAALKAKLDKDKPS